MSKDSAHIVCIIGGAVAGSEAASVLAERGIYSVVIDMGALPWGKIELGLPKWHSKQRDREEKGIDDKLNNPYVRYIPKTKLGSDLTFKEINSWGFNAILLATGAWRDRPLAVPGIDEYLGRGFYYQNPFVAWFNQYHDPGYTGPPMEIADDAMVVGGGLASLDVVKIFMLETTQRRLAEKGFETDIFTLEKKGIPKTLDRFGLEWEDLELKGCTLFYRRRAKDMPLVPTDEDEEPTPERLAKMESVREKLLQNFLQKYRFRFEPLNLPVDMAVEGDRLAGLVFQKTQVINRKVSALPGTEFEVRSPLIVSSIGSLPESISGLGSKGELFKIEDTRTGKVEGLPNVFALGNAVTGRGNIRASRIHGRSVARFVADGYLSDKEVQSANEIERILRKVKELQEKVEYDGDYPEWVQKHHPLRLESLKKS